MKWNNRLKSVLTQPGESEFSGECLETQLTKADKSHLKLVSSVIVSDEFRHFPENLTNSYTGEKESNLVSSAFVSGVSRQSFKKTDELADFKSEKLHEILNRFIAGGVSFDVSATDFQIIDGAQILKKSDREFLELNGDSILCQLQQSLLMKHLFNHSPDILEQFKFEVLEREAIMSGGGKITSEIYHSAVRETTRQWFAELLDKKDAKEK